MIYTRIFEGFKFFYIIIADVSLYSHVVLKYFVYRAVSRDNFVEFQLFDPLRCISWGAVVLQSSFEILKRSVFVLFDGTNPFYQIPQVRFHFLVYRVISDYFNS